MKMSHFFQSSHTFYRVTVESELAPSRCSSEGRAAALINLAPFSTRWLSQRLVEAPFSPKLEHAAVYLLGRMGWIFHPIAAAWAAPAQYEPSRLLSQ